MIRRDELIAMRAIALCFKPFLKPEEALLRFESNTICKEMRGIWRLQEPHGIL